MEGCSRPYHSDSAGHVAIWLGLCAALGRGITDFLSGHAAWHAGIGPTIVFTSFAGVFALKVWIDVYSIHTSGRIVHAVSAPAFV
jgi:hypothetical protein